jgi:RNA polymerase sigma factor (sigma-70 family)
MTTGGLGAAVALRREPVLRSRAAQGDARAFAALYERHHQALYRYCRTILRHDEDARDAVQSAMTLAFAALREEQRDFELRPWLFRIAHNEAISALRRRRPTEELDRAAGLCSDDLAQHVVHRERLEHLRVDLSDLPERQRAALVLRELSGLSHDEIAVVLDCSPRSVKQTIFEARKALGECAEGRAMSCDEVQRRLSDDDRRVLRGRRVRSHMRSCRSCKAFQSALGQRPADLAALAPPLPVAAGAALLSQLLAGAQAGAGAAGITGSKTVAVIAVSAALAGGAGTATQIIGDARPPASGAPVPERSGAAARGVRAASAAQSAGGSASAAAGLSSPVPDERRSGGAGRRAGERQSADAPTDLALSARAIAAQGAGPGAATAGGRPPARTPGTRADGADGRPPARTRGAGAGADGARGARGGAPSGGRRPARRPAASTTSAARRPARAPTGPAASAGRGRPAARGGPAATGSPGAARRPVAGRGEAGAHPQTPPAPDAGPAAPVAAGPPPDAGGDRATPRAASGSPSASPGRDAGAK